MPPRTDGASLVMIHIHAVLNRLTEGDAALQSFA